VALRYGAVALFLGLASTEAGAQTCPIVNDGTASGVVNTYYPGLNTVAAGATSLRVNMNATSGAGQAIAVSDLLLVIQMQDADINSANSASYGDGVAGGAARGETADNSTGLYEYVVAQTAAAVGSGANVLINITGGGAANGTINTYRTAASTTATGQRSYQVVKVARYRNVTLNGVTAAAWNGLAGGVVAIDAAGTVTLSANSVNVTGLGFRGGVGQQLAGVGGLSGTDFVRTSGDAAHGLKGEGIAGTMANLTGVGATRGYPTSVGGGDPNGDRARGAPGNAGGGGTDSNPSANDENSGGGGGSNGGQGGGGGNAWNSAATVGGYGGAAFPATFARLVMGGGGGAGTRNNSSGILSSGADGGGIVFVRAGLVAGTGTITADGDTGDAFEPLNDGGGGGGGGGSVLFVAPATVSLANLTILARGGRGSDAWPTQAPAGTPGERHGPGGGGGGGVRFTSVAVNGASSVAGGANGITTTVNDAFGSTAGAAGVTGTTTFDSVPGVQTCLAVTRAVVSGLRVSAGQVEFAVTSGRSVLGFNVIAESRNGRRVRLNRETLLSPLPDSLGPVLYRVPLRGPVPARVWIEELTRDGRVRAMGPYRTLEPGLEEAFARLEAREQKSEVRDNGDGRMLVATRPDPFAANAVASGRERRPTLPKNARAVKIEIGRGGLVRAPLEEWRRSGLFVDAATGGPRYAQRLYVTNLGRVVPFEIKEGVLEFQAESLSTDYTGRNPYVVSWGIPREPEVALTRSGFVLEPGFARVETNVLYAPFVAQGADPWIWDYATEGDAGPFAFDLPRLGAGAGSVAVRLGLIGGSEHSHHVSAEINGVPVGDLHFNGKVANVLEGDVPQDALHVTGNELRLRYEAQGSTAEDPGLVFLDVLDLAIPQTAPAGDAEVLGVTAYDATVPDLRGIDYLILTHADFMSAAERLRGQKEAEGFRVAVVDVDRAYDRYSGGAMEADAIRALIAGMGPGSRRHPRNVVLIGDDTYDPRDFRGVGDKSYVPSLYGWDGVFGRVPSETRFADIDGDGRPDVGIGRLPARTAAEADLLVEKIVRFRETGGRRGHLIAVDESQGQDISFRGEGESLEGRLPKGSVVFVDLGVQGLTAARSALLDGLKRGAQTTSYFGHGGFDVWSNQGLLRNADAAALEGTGQLTVLFSWTCETQWYVGEDRTVSEELLLVPDGGTVASVGPGGISDPALQANFSRRVYDYYLKGLSLGEAVRQAKSDALESDSHLSPVVQGFSLLGDPSIRLRP
jgi:Peptidase family C25